ncbi:Polysialic acid transport ATP-binding protein KpsT [Pseudovibrio axinellae]|uniref:Polysialic acid transport ATP-binding protein KpsT n=1 Tax=Pseudovibrio axinellae TaxID=989403 RepID=A0A165W8I6_9HYPH|nr:ABC transporter ATP-binding protein [Pseudovibrio axinellae]KZL16188.1 Polysialic acid transport ATP-binding protein KpsT [Pseudovibrio axinellae]SER76279.1 capsular polysaccharide transport system ATP-binding protein [Pseudovibrio axinellae]
MIEFQNVRKTYRLKGVTKTILHGLTAKFPKGKNVGILGHNGAGKSTLMRLIAGAELPDSGRIKRNVKVSWPLGFGGGFAGKMTGIENTRFVARMYGQDTERMVEFVEDFSELGPSMSLPIQTYSSGMKARLAFGVSMAIDFDCYLIDEITAVGDARFKQKCNEMFESKLKHSNIIMISHSEGTIKKFCDTACLLHEGRLKMYDSLAEGLAQHRKNQLK